MPIVRASPSSLISLACYGSRERRLAITSQKSHRRTYVLRKTLSSAQKAARKLQHATHRTTFNATLEDAFWVVMKQAEVLADTFPTHNMQYYFQLLMQHAQKKGGRWKINLWNAFINDQRDKAQSEYSFMYFIQLIPTLIDEGAIRSATFLARDLRATWNAMSQEERVETTKDAVERIQEQCDAKSLALHNVPLSCFHDARATL